MHLRHLLLPLALVAVAACHEDGVTVNARPPLGGVRFINAVPDGGPVDIRMVDQVEWSASSVSTNTIGLPFRTGTIHWPTEAKARRIRVFPTDSAIAVTSTILLDTTITIERDKNVSLVLIGSRAAGGKISFMMVDDTPPQLNGTQIAVRVVNASGAGTPTASSTGYITATAASTPGAVANFPSVGSMAASNFVVRDTGTFSIRTTAVGNATVLATGTAPAGAPADGLIGATAGTAGPGSAMSAYIFPRSVVGTTAPQTAAFNAPAIAFFIDRIPTPPK